MTKNITNMSSPNTKKVLIVGIDSAIGEALREFLMRDSYIVQGTTRRSNFIDKDIYFLDLMEPSLDIFEKKFDSVIICAGVTSISKCEEEFELSKTINVTNTIKIIDKAVSDNSFVIFISSNSVFDGSRSFYKYTDQTNPTTLYGQFKNSVEQHILSNAFNKACILRITKVITKNSAFIRKWEMSAEKKTAIEAFNNILISPIRIETVVQSLKLLINKEEAGLFQLGGDKEISFYDYAKDYFSSNKRSLSLIKSSRNTLVPKGVIHNSLASHLP